MNFKIINRIFGYALFVFLFACIDADDETNLINLHTVASQDIISISFPADTETTLSINSQFDFNLQGLKSNGVDVIPITNDIQWSLSDGAISSIDQNGLFSASATAEIITVTAQFGIFSESIEIMVSDAEFDQVVGLNESAFTVDMCRSQALKPIGRYVDALNNEEIRPVDSIIISTIEWIIREQSDNSLSQRAHIETLNNQATLHTLTEGNIIIQAKAFSPLSNNTVTSVDFNQPIDNNLNSIKLCDSSDTDLINCNVPTDLNVEKDRKISLIAVANYQASDGSDFNENISKNSKWGIDSPLNASIAFPTDRQRLEVTGLIEETTATVSVACGDIDQPIDAIDITTGVVFDTAVSCSSSTTCSEASKLINIEPLSVSSLKVTANDTELESDITEILSTRPDEITLITTALFSNNTEKNVTADSNLTYTVNVGRTTIIEQKTDSPGVYTVLSSGAVEIKIDFGGKEFFVLIEIP